MHSSSVYSCHPFLISSVSVRSLPFLFFTVPIFAWNIPLASLIFLKRSLVYPNLLLSSISLHWSLRKSFLSLLAILWNSAFKWEYLSFSPLSWASLLSTAIFKASSDNHYVFLNFFSLGMILIPASCTIFKVSSRAVVKSDEAVNWEQYHSARSEFGTRIEKRWWVLLSMFGLEVWGYFVETLVDRKEWGSILWTRWQIKGKLVNL